MININKKALSVLLVLGFFVAIGYFGPNVARANGNNPAYTTLVSKVAERFNLDESDVEAVFTAVHDERQAEMKARKEEQLNDAVQDGVITQSQKTAMLAKMEQHRQMMQKSRGEMHQWFVDQGIDPDRIRGYLGGGHRGDYR